VLTALRKAAKGDPVAVVLDGPGAASLPSLPFAGELEVVARSPKLPAGLVVTIDGGPPADAAKKLDAALLALRGDKAGAAALDGIQMDRFVAVDGDALAAARKAYDAAAAGR
jgi:ABC-type phosphate/phosphonate transport system substrate-binding protein